jgi:hypothetical protein
MAGVAMMAGGVALSSLATSATEFILTYGLMFGFGIGLAYSCPLVCGLKWVRAVCVLLCDCMSALCPNIVCFFVTACLHYVPILCARNSQLRVRP